MNDNSVTLFFKQRYAIASINVPILIAGEASPGTIFLNSW